MDNGYKREYMRIWMRNKRKNLTREEKNKIKQYNKDYYQKNKERLNEYNGKYYQEHKEKMRLATVRWVDKNRDKYNKYQKQYREKNKDKFNDIVRKSRDRCKDKIKNRYLKNKEKHIRERELYNFGITKEELYKIRGNACERCGDTNSRLDLHHIDKKGSTLPRAERNNKLSNLMLVCRSCHQKLDYAPLIQWARKYDKCQVCKTTKKPHARFGLCTVCAGRSRNPNHLVEYTYIKNLKK